MWFWLYGFNSCNPPLKMMLYFTTLLQYEIIFIPGIIFLILTSFTFVFFKEVQQKLIIDNSTKTSTIITKTTFNVFVESYKPFLIVLARIYILYFIFWFLNTSYFFSYTSLFIFSSFQLTNYIWLYITITIFLCLILLLIFYQLINFNYFNSYEFWLGLIYFFISTVYYFLLNNMVSFFFIFEVQGLIFLYLIIVNWEIKSKFLQTNLNYLQYTNLNTTWYFNALILQFWVSFFSAILFIFGILLLLQSTTFNEWENILIFSYFSTFLNFFPTTIWLGWLFICLSLSLKLGLLPFFLWKPEIYKYLNIFVLCLYMTIYIFNIINFVIFLFTYYMVLIKDWYIILIYFISLVTFILIPIFFFSITEIRTFLALSSVIQITYIFSLLLFFSKQALSIMFLYTYVYFSYMILFFIIIFSLNYWNIWYLTDLQFLSSKRYLLTGLVVLFLGSAGIPPFLGFFTKLSVISFLIFSTEYMLALFGIIGGYFSAYFYWQLLRFLDYQPNKLTYKANVLLIKNSYFLYLFYLLIFFNFFAYIFFSDFLIFTTYLAMLL